MQDRRRIHAARFDDRLDQIIQRQEFCDGRAVAQITDKGDWQIIKVVLLRGHNRGRMRHTAKNVHTAKMIGPEILLSE